MKYKHKFYTIIFISCKSVSYGKPIIYVLHILYSIYQIVLCTAKKYTLGIAILNPI